MCLEEVNGLDRVTHVAFAFKVVLFTYRQPKLRSGAIIDQQDGMLITPHYVETKITNALYSPFRILTEIETLSPFARNLSN